MSLRGDFIEGLFARLTLRYGSAFMDRWDGLPIAAVKKDWTHELAGFARRPKVIEHASALLDPVGPPAAVQFRTLCLTMAAPVRRPQLPPKLAHRAADVLLPQRLHVSEAVCEGATLRLTCLSTDAQLDPRTLIGVPLEMQLVTDRGLRTPDKQPLAA
ncbi:hypothetical protein [Azohydromonas lata]|uniref:hypothetical protein n=1 Tax=Azohydromonas lata TaxID=45677 RepID=UPI00082A4D2D|nr:hypothetical protein [Azohydromonas lata]